MFLRSSGGCGWKCAWWTGHLRWLWQHKNRKGAGECLDGGLTSQGAEPMIDVGVMDEGAVVEDGMSG